MPVRQTLQVKIVDLVGRALQDLPGGIVRLGGRATMNRRSPIAYHHPAPMGHRS
jgi:hypothetical protein